MDLQGRKVLVVGLARTGVATVQFLQAKGSIVSTTETKPMAEMREVIQALEGTNLQTEWGGHQTETFLKQDLIVVSPGVDLKIEPIQAAQKKGIRVISEVELAYQFIDVPVIAVTGTNGKTTTTLLIGEMLKQDGRKVGVGGNVGDPLILFAEGGDRWEVLVAEVSSFQLEAIEDFRPKISVLLNITEDHLDRYTTFKDYINAKARMFINQNSGDVAVLNKDDPIVMGVGKKVRAKAILFSMKEKLEEGAYSNGQNTIFRFRKEEEHYPLTKTLLKGVHNVENMMAALMTARIYGCSKEAIEIVLNRFEGLEHRLEFVREIDGVRFYNDSKGIRTRVRRLVLLGEAKERMSRELGNLTDTVMVGTLEEAVRLAHRSAKKGDVVLLSPACSSFDMFKDYQERGKTFKDAVRRL
jgi:UDP-N-acetylmuramoylalanine--D-glutamate ligase